MRVAPAERADDDAWRAPAIPRSVMASITTALSALTLRPSPARSQPVTWSDAAQADQSCVGGVCGIAELLGGVDLGRRSSRVAVM
jgi:hypothetical protein